MTDRSWVQTPTMETIFQAPFIWIKAWNKNCGKTLTWHWCICCNPANGRVDFVELSAYKNPATWYWMNCKLVSRLRPKSKKKKKKKKSLLNDLEWLRSPEYTGCRYLQCQQWLGTSSWAKKHWERWRKPVNKSDLVIFNNVINMVVIGIKRTKS